MQCDPGVLVTFINELDRVLVRPTLHNVNVGTFKDLSDEIGFVVAICNDHTIAAKACYVITPLTIGWIWEARITKLID